VVRRDKIGLGLVALALAAVTLSMMLSGPRMPEYKGKTLEAWIADCHTDAGGFQFETEEATAVRRIGTNALPVLLSWVLYEPPPWNVKVVAAFDALFPKARSSKVRSRLAHEEAIGRAEFAKGGFYILGPQASPAISILLEHLPRARSAQVKYNIMYSLGVIQPELKVLAGRVSIENLEIAEASVEGLRLWGINEPDIAVPALAGALRNSPFVTVRRTAAQALGGFREPGQVAVDALKAAAGDSDGEVRVAANQSLRFVEHSPNVWTNR